MHMNREELMASNNARRAELQAEIDERRERRLAEPFPDDVPPPQPRVVEKSYVGRAAVQQADPWAGWNEWAGHLIKRALDRNNDALASIFGEMTGENERKLRDELRAEIQVLRDEVASLRADLQRAHNVRPTRRWFDAKS